MSQDRTLQVGTLNTTELLDQYQNALKENLEAAFHDSKNHGVDGAFRAVGMWGGGALLGTVGTVAAMALTNIPGTVFNNPVLSAVAIAGAVAGVAGGAWLNRAVAKEQSETHEYTKAALAATEQQLNGIELPDLKEQLQLRREAALVQAQESIDDQKAKSTRRNGIAFGMGAMGGSS